MKEAVFFFKHVLDFYFFGMVEVTKKKNFFFLVITKKIQIYSYRLVLMQYKMDNTKNKPISVE